MNVSAPAPNHATGDGHAVPPPWHAVSAAEAMARLGLASLTTGLSTTEAAARLQRFGPNTLTAKEGRSWLVAFSAQFAAVLVWLLLAAAGVSAVLGEWVDVGVIAAIIVLNAVIGASQEFSAERSIAALRGMTAPKARVMRDGGAGGGVVVVPAAEVVPGDVLVLEAGDLVAADARLVESTSLSAIEKSLTGESEPAEKDARAVAPPPPADTPLADRLGMVHAGTAVATGTARAVVVATGMQTEMGRIAALISSTESDGPTPLQARLAQVGRWLVVAALAIVAGLFGLGLLRGEPLLGLFMTAVSMAVAAVPEGLPAIVTVALALGVRRMARRRALIRHLPAVETLGATGVICTDKTGTLTVGQMTARALVVPAGRAGGALTTIDVSGEGYAPEGAATVDGAELDADARAAGTRFARNLAGVNDACIRREKGLWEAAGDPTEAAMLVAASKLGLTRETLDAASPRAAEAPFDSDRKRAAVVRRTTGGAEVLVNGSPESVLALCTHISDGDGPRPMTAADRAAIAAANEGLAQRGLRVLASAVRLVPHEQVAATIADPSPAALERELSFVGLVGLLDPPRPEARAAVAKCKAAGIRVVMITGDQPKTALAIARDLGIATESDAALSGVELAAIPDATLPATVARTAVYARVTAADKLRIVRAWREQGVVVAMTGDGVNDAPALKGADVGIAMGASGTEVARQASDMVITDDNFASIVAAVEEGRGVYDNVKKAMQYLLGGNAAELLFMAAALVAGLPTPLLPIQILWINLVTDGLPALFLAADPAPPGLMERSPRARSAAILDRAFVGTMLVTALLTSGVVMGVYLYGLAYHGETIARTHAFAALVFAELLRSFGARSATVPIWRMGWRGNVMLLAVVVGSIALQLWTHHNQTLSSLMRTAPVSWTECILLLGVSCVPLAALELVKVLRTRRVERP